MRPATPGLQPAPRPGRIYILSKLVECTIEEDAEVVLTFIDFVSAFDTVSHKFLDEALGKAGVPVKCRAVIRAIYKSATGAMKVPNADGTYTLSETFPVDRGVVQGDIVSPLCFIIALHRIRQLVFQVTRQKQPFQSSSD